MKTSKTLPEPRKTFNSSYSSTMPECEPELTLLYTPESGEGESVKVLLAYLGLPYTEILRIKSISGPDTILKSNDKEVSGTLECLKYLSNKFGMHENQE